MYESILIATDGSEVAQKGVDHGLSLAKALGAKVTIIIVTERFPIYAGSIGFEYAVSAATMADYTASQKEAAARVLTAAREAAERLGVAAEGLHVPDAQPAEAIVEAAKACNCGLIVMASHGHRGLSRLVLGSTTSEVLARGTVPVLVVR